MNRTNVWKILVDNFSGLFIILMCVCDPYQCLKNSRWTIFLVVLSFWWVSRTSVFLCYFLVWSVPMSERFTWPIFLVWVIPMSERFTNCPWEFLMDNFFNLDVWVVPVSERFSVDIVADSRLNSPLSSILIDSSLMFIWGQNIWLQVNLIWPILFFETKDLIHYLNF